MNPWDVVHLESAHDDLPSMGLSGPEGGQCDQREQGRLAKFSRARHQTDLCLFLRVRCARYRPAPRFTVVSFLTACEMCNSVLP